MRSMRSSDGKYSLSVDDQFEIQQAPLKQGYTIPGGGELVICQVWRTGDFVAETHCYAEIGAVEMWYHYMDRSSGLCCVNNCWSVGNLFHLDWAEMEPKGNLSGLTRTENICNGK